MLLFSDNTPAMDKQDTAWLDPAAGEEPVRVQGKREGHACINDVLVKRAQQLATATHVRTLTYKALNGTVGRRKRNAAETGPPRTHGRVRTSKICLV
jgi:hypothetical protein